jgi:hypothetical protein
MRHAIWSGLMRPTILCTLSTAVTLTGACMDAAAATALEHRIAANPMPHLALSGADETVHYTRLTLQRTDALAAQMRKQLEKRVQRCVRDQTARGRAVNPPRDYPDLSLELTYDTYWTANRAIRYGHAYFADYDANDCSLKEREDAGAELSSARGTCTIDLLARTSKGVCDPAVHAKAPPLPAAPPSAPAPGMAPLPKSADPRIQAMAERLQKLSTGAGATGQKKNIAGATCDVYPAPAGGTQCLARGGTLRAARLFGNLGNGLVLENDYGNGLVIKAEQVKFDARVSAQVFAPHSANGFRGSATVVK